MAAPTQDPLHAFAHNFHESGFGVIRQAVTPQAVTALRSRLVQLLPGTDTPGHAPLQRLIPRLVELDDGFLGFATSPSLVATMEAVFQGVVPHLVCSYGHEKPARTAAHTGPHSDVSHLPGVPHHRSLLMVKAMLALTPVTDGSGPTMLFPGSHRQPEPAAGASAETQRMLLEPGDLLLFHANIRHTATANTSNTSRLSAWLVYALPWMRTFTGYDYGPDFLATLQPRLAERPRLAPIFGLTDPYATTPGPRT